MNSNSNLKSNDICHEVMERFNVIDIDRFLKDLDLPDKNDRELVCRLLAGAKPDEIARERGYANSADIRNIISAHKIYSRISKVLGVDDIAGNWAKIIYHLLDPQKGYRLNPVSMPNVDTLMSFGNQILLRRNNPDVLMLQQRAAHFYRNGAYFSAFDSFLEAWKIEPANPESLIYIINCLIEENKIALEQRKIQIYTIAVVVPIHHNMGKVATELLYGVAEIQLQITLHTLLSQFKTGSILSRCNKLLKYLNINYCNNLNAVTTEKMVVRLLIVNEDNNLNYQGNMLFNQTAQDLAQVANELRIMAVIGHYSSEMTEQALKIYADQGLLLITPSSTSDRLPNFADRNFFLRITTHDTIAAQSVAEFLRDGSESQERVAIIYNKSSSYCQSFRNAIRKHLEQNPEKFKLLEDCGELSNGYFQSIKPYLQEITKQAVTKIIIIPDGGIDPNSLNAAGAISRLNMKNCLIIGSATFYHENVLEWVGENISRKFLDKNNAGHIFACVPWHCRRINSDCSCKTSNPIAAYFCSLGSTLWGEEKVTWRSATAYDSVLMVVKALGKHPTQNREKLREKINEYFREGNQSEMGVTGEIRFDANGNRINPPTEIVAIACKEEGQRCQFVLRG